MGGTLYLGAENDLGETWRYRSSAWVDFIVCLFLHLFVFCMIVMHCMSCVDHEKQWGATLKKFAADWDDDVK